MRVTWLCFYVAIPFFKIVAKIPPYN